MLLVMALIVIALSLAVPSFEALLAGGRDVAARDLVRARWAEMRAKAMEEGRAYRFAVTENTGRFRVAPDDDAYWSGKGADEFEDRPLILEGELPEGVLFTTSDTAFAGIQDAPAPGPDWGVTIAVYLADGTARDDAKVYFGKAGQRVLGLRLRGLTGAVSAMDPSSDREEEVSP
jgi:hypothetical protein